MHAARSFALALTGAAALGACGHRAEKASLPAPEAMARAARVGVPATRLETGLARATGTIRAKEDAVISAKGTGQIRRVRVSVGDRVQLGQALVEMDPANAQVALANAQAAVRLAEANLAAAERELKRGQSLNDQQAMADAGLDRVKTAHEMAAAQLDQARAGLRGAEQLVSDTVLTAPFAGIITARYRNAGDTVTLMPVSPIVALTDVDHLEARLAVPETIEAFVSVGQLVEGAITPSEQKFAAKVRAKGAVVDPMTRTVEVLVDVVKTDGPPLRPGSLVNVDFGSYAAKDGLFVPASALRSDAGTQGSRADYVFVLVGGKAEKRAVVTAPITPGTLAVRSGLSATDRVILDPGGLAPGDAVVPLAD